LIHIGTILVLTGCGGSRQPVDSAKGGAAFRVALLTPGPVSDQSWNGGAYQGLLRIRDSLGAQISHIQTKTPAEFEENFRQYGAQGYSLVFGHGFEFQDAAKAVAPAYPRTMYVITSGRTVGDNISGIGFGFADPSYLAGMIAGAITRTDKVGVIGGTELPPVRESFQAFSAGAKAVNPRVQVTSSYIGNWDDVSAGKEQALAQIGHGVDVIFQNADAAGLGVFQAARETKKALVIGSNSNQNGVAPEVTIGSVAIDLPHAFLIVAREVHEHTLKPGLIVLGMRDNVVELVLNPALESKVPATARRAVDSTRALMLAGKFRARIDSAVSVAR
jgi:basic membrane lipoprotein Med (substrate-binding protein (PBP1-ABC) superfamily)